MRRAVALLLALGTLSGLAAAQPEPAAENVDSLMRDLEQEETTLATADCDTACRALDAIRRISARICELDPGPPCERSRKKLEDATRRVDNACGPCAQQGKARKLEDKDGVTTTGEAAPEPAQAPPSEQSGGCASCAIGSRRDAPGVFLLLLALLPSFRRASRRRSSTDAASSASSPASPSGAEERGSRAARRREDPSSVRLRACSSARLRVR